MKKYMTTYIRPLVLVATLAASSLLAVAQGPIEAYRFGLQGLHGTARAQALSGAVGAVGADPTALYVNPAGVALYNRNLLSISLDPGFATSQARWGEISKGNDYRVGGFNNISYVTPIWRDNRTGSKFNLAISYGRTYDYDRNYMLSMGGTTFGLTDYISNLAMYQGIPYRDYLAGNNYNPFMQARLHPLVSMGVNSYLIEGIDPNGGDDNKSTYFRPAFSEPDPSNKDKRIFLSPQSTLLNVQERGGRHSFDITSGFTVADVLHLGVAMRFGRLSYHRTSTHRETFHYETPKVTNNSEFSLYNDLHSSGSSIAANLGAIVMLGDYVRLGVSYLTPEFYRMLDTYSSQMKVRNEVNLPEYQNSSCSTGVMETAYYYKTPGQLTASAMLLLGNFGFVSYDYQYRNLGTATLSDDQRVRFATSDYIAEDYTVEHQHRVGFEVRPTERLALRAGASFVGNPLKSEELKDEPKDGLLADAGAVGTTPDFTLPRSYTTYTCGLGYRFGRNVQFDLAYSHATRKEMVYPYSGQAYSKGDNFGENVTIKGGTLTDLRQNLTATLSFTF